jgi:hypothetical protein
MFTWICPTCGREVPPSYDECPDCAAKAKAGQAVEAAPPPAAPVPQMAAPPPLPMPHRVAARAAVPTWLLTILFAFAFVGLLGGAYWLVHYFRGSGNQTAAATTPFEPVPAKGQAKQNPLQPFVEVTGIRFLQNPKKVTEARFLVVNHSGADITGLAGNVNIWGRTAKSEEEAAGTFSFKVPSLGPYESKEVTAPVNTKLKVYELPDWQNITPEVQITSP